MSDLKVALEVTAKDGATPVLKKVAAAVDQPAKAATRGLGAIGKLGDALGRVAAGVKGVGAESDGLGGLESRLTGIVSKVGALGVRAWEGAREGIGRIGEAAEQAEGSYESLAATIGGGIEIGELIKDNDAFDRIRVLSGATREEIDGLREDVLAAAKAWGVETSQIRAGIDVLRQRSTSIADIREETDLLAESIQVLGGRGEEIGKLFAAFRQFEGAKGPEGLLEMISLLQSQLGTVPGQLAGFTPGAPGLLSAYQARGQSGPEAIRDIGAIYGVIAQSTRSPRQALAQTSQLIGLFNDRTLGEGLGSLLGHSVYTDPANRQIKPLGEILPEILAKYSRNPEGFANVLGPDFARAFSLPLAEAARNGGRSPTLDRLLGTHGEPEKFKADARELGDSFEGSLHRVKAALDGVGEAVLKSPLEWLAGVLSSHPTGIGITGAVIGGAGILIEGIGLLRRWGGILKWAFGVMELAPLAGGAISLGLGIASFAMRAFSVVLLGTPVGWILLGLTAIAGAAYLIYRNWEPIKKFFGDLWDWVVKKFEWAKEGILNAMPSWMRDGALDPSGPGRASGAAAGGATAGVLAPAPIFTPPMGKDAKKDTNTALKITFENTPPGAKISSVTSNVGDLTVDFGAGYAMAAP